ncbi:MAG: hypothetical protein WBN32_09680 [Woeseia sp.]
MRLGFLATLRAFLAPVRLDCARAVQGATGCANPTLHRPFVRLQIKAWRLISRLKSCRNTDACQRLAKTLGGFGIHTFAQDDQLSAKKTAALPYLKLEKAFERGENFVRVMARLNLSFEYQIKFRCGHMRDASGIFWLLTDDTVCGMQILRSAWHSDQPPTRGPPNTVPATHREALIANHLDNKQQPAC